jgi:hypothetical protein
MISFSVSVNSFSSFLISGRFELLYFVLKLYFIVVQMRWEPLTRMIRRIAGNSGPG